MRALAAAYAIAAALAMPALIWAADGPPADAGHATTTTTSPASDPPAAPPEVPAAPATEPTAPPPAPVPAPAPAAPPATAGQAVAAQPATTTSTTAAAPASKTRAAPTARITSSNGVTIKNFLFNPATVTVNVGDTVTWTNQDSTPHTATASDGSFDTGSLSKGRSGSHTFTQAGSFAYICSIHPNMKGTVVVRAASSGGAAGSGSGSSGSTSGSGSGAADTSGSLASGTSSGSSASGSSLPNTGLDAAVVALAGLLLLGGGMLLRRRVSRP